MMEPQPDPFADLAADYPALGFLFRKFAALRNDPRSLRGQLYLGKAQILQILAAAQGEGEAEYAKGLLNAVDLAAARLGVPSPDVELIRKTEAMVKGAEQRIAALVHSGAFTGIQSHAAPFVIAHIKQAAFETVEQDLQGTALAEHWAQLLVFFEDYPKRALSAFGIAGTSEMIQRLGIAAEVKAASKEPLQRKKEHFHYRSILEESKRQAEQAMREAVAAALENERQYQALCEIKRDPIAGRLDEEQMARLERMLMMGAQDYRGEVTEADYISYLRNLPYPRAMRMPMQRVLDEVVQRLGVTESPSMAR